VTAAVPGGRAIGVAAIVVSTLAESLGQLAFKRSTRAGLAMPGVVPAGPLLRAFRNWRWLALGFAGFAADGLLWSVALRLLDVTVAHPLGSLVFVVTAMLSRAVLRERIPPRRWAGIALILVGSAVVAAN
jgi:undecaprenyl phosphate-alpha-L-ara4N flippase subunit ArnE